jgi:hypothetical protein
MKRYGFRVKPFEDTVLTQVDRFPNGKWGWYEFPPLGEESSSKDYDTRQLARIARKMAIQDSIGSGTSWGYQFQNL